VKASCPGLLLLVGCGGFAPSWATAVAAPAVQSEPAPELLEEPARHAGPGVAEGAGGPARFARRIYEGFDVEAALEVLRFTDGFYRSPGNPGYDLTLERVRARLAASGFGSLEGFELEMLETPLSTPPWTPKSGRLEALLPGGEVLVLHAFDRAGDVDRVMLPMYAPSADVEGRVVFDLADVGPGTLLVSTENLAGRVVAQLAKRGACAVLSAHIEPFTRDPSGGDAHLDAIQFRSVSRSTRLPVAQISPRSHALLVELARKHPSLRLRLRAQVEWGEGPLRTLVARVLGSSRPDEVVAVASHVQEPGAGDNASGVAGLCEAAAGLARACASGELERPARTLVFLWGDEMRQTSIWLEHNRRRVIAGISADMLGQSRAQTGSICLLERGPDPGALDTLPPDAHTPWGAGQVEEQDLAPNGLALIGRVALVDVGRLVGGWATSENPWEGGSDHDIFLGRGVPGVLFWHFTDFTYHTSLDRLERIDPEELRRSSSAILATALALADLRSADLERLKASNVLERELRVGAALEAARPDVAKRWREWCHGVELWLETSCVDAARD
jgi:hypothetical protein